MSNLKKFYLYIVRNGSIDRMSKRISLMISKSRKQTTSNILMIRPCRFFSNPETAKSNKFQGKSVIDGDELQRAALDEFDQLVEKLRQADLNIIQFDDTPEPPTPDSVFPNNWISMHADGTVVLYPMEAINRRTERRSDIVKSLVEEYGFSVNKTIDLTSHESKSRYLEGTGSMVLDHINRITYSCISSRTDELVLFDFSKQMNYTVVSFNASDSSGSSIYHTNVIMSLGENIAVLCEDAIKDNSERENVLSSLESSNHEIVCISLEQMHSFSGNVLEVISNGGEKLMLMSSSAEKALTDSQYKTISKYCRIVSSPIDNIEASAGGSVRCMMAEIFLPKN